MKNKLWFFLAIIILTFEICNADSSNISNLVFISETQNIKVGEISTELKVQTKNSSGEVETVSETNDVNFSSSSVTGEFLNSSGGAVSKTMSKNTSSRVFYYRDTTLGTHTIRVEIKGRDTGKVFVASQEITVSNGGSGPTTDNGSTATTTTTIIDTTATSTSNINSNILNQPLSSHSKTVSITYIFEKPGLSVSAGRNRITTTGTPIVFDADVSGMESLSGKIEYVWSFGDGTSDTGKEVTHYYKFAGDYNVVLNISNAGEHAVSRTIAKVIDPEVQIVDVLKGEEGFVELQNNSDYEVNIENWKISDGKSELMISPDTIIDAHKKIKIPYTSQSHQGEVSLFYPKEKLAQTFIKEEPHPVYIPQKIVINEPDSITNDSNNIQNNSKGASHLEPSGTSTPELSIIDTADKDAPNIASPQGFFDFIKNFFTK